MDTVLPVTSISGAEKIVHEEPDGTPPGMTQLELLPDRSMLVMVPVKALPEASFTAVIAELIPPATPWLK
jgi:hypothetical protein